MRRFATPAGLLLVLVAVVCLVFLVSRDEPRPPVEPGRDSGGDPHSARLRGQSDGKKPGDATTDAPGMEQEPEGRGRLEVLVVRAEDEMPIQGASVVWRHDDTETEAQTATDSEGFVRWAGLEPGLGSIVVRAPGFGRVKELALATREDERCNLQKVLLAPAVTLRGVTVDAMSGKPLQGANVSLFSVHAPIWSKDPCYVLREEIESTTADAQGEFRFDCCSRWTGDEMLALVVRAAGYAPIQKLVLTPDPLLEARRTAFAVPPAGRIEGVLRDADGNGVPGVVIAAPAELDFLLRYGKAVRVLPGGNPLWASPVRPEGLVDLYDAQRVNAGPDGRFLFDHLPLRSKVVLQGKTVDERPSERSAPIRVSRESTPVDLVFARPGRLVASVRNADGSAHPGAHVTWRRYLSEVDFYATLEKRKLDTNADGTAEFSVLTPGPFEVSAWDEGFREVSERGVLEPGGTVTRELITWPKTDTPRPEPMPTRPSRDVPWSDSEGTTSSPARPPVVIRATLVLPPGDSLPRGYTLHYDGEDYCGSTSGTWRIDHGQRLTVEREFKGGIPTTITAQVSGYLPEEWQVAADSMGIVDLDERTLDPGLAVSGCVRDVDGRPVVGVGVSLGTPGADPELFEVGEFLADGVTDRNGCFRITSLPPGESEWVVRTPWFHHKQRVQIHAGMSPLEARIPAQALIYCRVVDSDGIPVAGVHVTVRSTNAPLPGRRSWHGPSDSGGQARATVIAGRWRVEAKWPGEWGKPPPVGVSEEVEVTGGGETSVVLVIARQE